MRNLTARDKAIIILALTGAAVELRASGGKDHPVVKDKIEAMESLSNEFISNADLALSVEIGKMMMELADAK